MSSLNHTPLSDEHKPKPPSVAAVDSIAPKQPPQPITVRHSPESAPIHIPENKPAESNTPAENLPLQEAKEHKVNDDQVTPYVEEKQENIELPPELKVMGLKAVTSTNFPSYQNIKLPISDEKVLIGEKAPPTSSLRWLAEFAKFLLWRAHITLKTVHGHVVRVIKK